MTRRKSIIGALALCALALCAFGAASASALGVTAVECVGKAGGKYNTSQCLTPAVPGNFETEVITNKVVEGKSTTQEHKAGSTTTTPTSIFHSIVGGVEVTVTCGTGTTTGGTVVNKEEKNAEEKLEMKTHTTGAVTKWTECHASPRTKPTKTCKVQGTAPATAVGTVETNKLTAITGPGDTVTIKPEGTEVFTKFTILKSSEAECFTGSDLPVEVTKEAKGEVNTTTHNHLTLNEANQVGSPLRANGTEAKQTETISGFTPGTAIPVGVEKF